MVAVADRTVEAAGITDRSCDGFLADREIQKWRKTICGERS
jgi:hypothetical protein